MEEFKDYMLTEKDARYLSTKEVFYHLIECNKDIPEISEINWVIHVVESPDINAFVLPVSKCSRTLLLNLTSLFFYVVLIAYIIFSMVQNGHVFIFTGLLNSVTDTHQLSFLLGHEIAHAVLGHAVST